MTTEGTLWILPKGTEEVHHLDADHVAAVCYNGDVVVTASAGTVIGEWEVTEMWDGGEGGS